MHISWMSWKEQLAVSNTSTENQKRSKMSEYKWIFLLTQPRQTHPPQWSCLCGRFSPAVGKDQETYDEYQTNVCKGHRCTLGSYNRKRHKLQNIDFTQHHRAVWSTWILTVLSQQMHFQHTARPLKKSTWYTFWIQMAISVPKKSTQRLCSLPRDSGTSELQLHWAPIKVFLNLRWPQHFGCYLSEK